MQIFHMGFSTPFKNSISVSVNIKFSGKCNTVPRYQFAAKMQIFYRYVPGKADLGVAGNIEILNDIVRY